MRRFYPIIIGCLLVGFFLSAFNASAQNWQTADPIWLSLSRSDEEGSSPQAVVNQFSENSLDVTITFAGLWAEAQTQNGEPYTRIWHDDFGSYREPGKPALPGKAFNILVPNGVQVEVINETFSSKPIGLSDYSLPKKIIPAQIQAAKSEPAPPWTAPDHRQYGSHDPFPQTWFELKDSFRMRDYTIQPIWVNPVRYIAPDGEVELLEKLSLRLIWQDNTLDGVKSTVLSDSPSFDRLVSQIVINPPEPALYDTKSEMGEGYLIITPDIFYDELQPFVNLKSSQGYEVEVKKLSEIDDYVGSTDSEIDDISAIQNFIRSVEPPPVYLLLVGDTNLIPAPKGDVTNLKTDLYYATLDEVDYVPDIHIGRLPARIIEDLSTILNNIISYSNSGHQDWNQNSSFIGTCDNNYNHHIIAESTHEQVVDLSSYYLFLGNFPYETNPVGGDRLYCVSNSATEEDVITNINLKRGIIIYSGHGTETAWYDIDVDLDINGDVIARREITINSEDVKNRISTNDVHPFVSSFACSTNNFGSSTNLTGFGETWMLQESKGSVGYFGSAAPSYWEQDRLLEINMFDHLFNNPSELPSIGESIETGLLSLESKYTDQGLGGFQYYLETYNLLGDPSQKLWLVPNNRVYMPVIFK